MRNIRKVAIGAAGAAALIGIPATAVAAADGAGADGPDVPISGPALERASQAALAATGGGEVVDSEIEENGYELEVNLEDGRQIEVQLNEDFAVVSSDENEEGDDGDAD